LPEHWDNESWGRQECLSCERLYASASVKLILDMASSDP
jgi:hypothetical protein